MCLHSNWISHSNDDDLAACFGGLLYWLLLPGVCGRKGKELQFNRIIRHFVQDRVVFFSERLGKKYWWQKSAGVRRDLL